MNLNAITLWRFGAERLLGGAATSPLRPLGTAEGGVETTYLYQALNPAVMSATSSGIPSFQPTLIPTPRIVIVSASGWREPEQSLTCSFFGANFGGCVGGGRQPTSGTATPEVLPIISVPSLASVPTATVTESTAIVGGTLGGFSAILLVVCLILLIRLRRHTRSKSAVDFLPRVYDDRHHFSSAMTRMPLPEKSDMQPNYPGPSQDNISQQGGSAMTPSPDRVNGILLPQKILMEFDRERVSGGRQTVRNTRRNI
ncbi:hypothetical protein D9757_001569 [Collybiopsis confluens]|uniref:Uncharacterized protein n=1 Tax=Collybiopsis confluens TaxID=2823264 RepID=A0A8H5MFV2_9AGAR|nr:hypothetical protein D9757_001569 [Collybiopsis confluens]